VKQLAAAIPHVYRTDRDGTVRLTVDGAAMHVSTAR
jgi:beta-lactamase superfamily II metal-dependent hydrolase